VVPGAPSIEDQPVLELFHSPCKGHDSVPNLAPDEGFTAPRPMNYEAVSYAWESDKEYRPVKVLYGRKRYIWDIRRSVETMLRHLRFQAEWKRTLWIDALCINQEDDSDKAIQVEEMGSLYETPHAF
jgi:hypothetical protein